jgi:hypothetical protein
VKLRYQLERPNLAAQRARRPMCVIAEVSPGGVRLEATAEVTLGRTVRTEVVVPGDLEAARDPARMALSARTAFEKLGDTRFRLEELDWRNPTHRFVPVSRLNEARRALADALDASISADARARSDAARAAHAPCPAPPPGDRIGFTVKVDRLETLDAFEREDFDGSDDVIVDLALLPLRGLAERLDDLAARAGRERLRLGLPLIVRGWEQRALRARIDALRAAGYRRWEVTGPASWALLGLAPGDAGGLDLSSDWSLHTVNRAAARQLQDMGVGRITLSTEDAHANMAALLGQLGLAAAVVVYEDSPLFISESCPYANLAGSCPGPADCTFVRMELTSSHGGKVLVMNERCRSFTLNDVPYNLSPRLAALREAGARNFRVHFVHRTYAPEHARTIWRALRRGEAIRPGHTGSLERERW